MRRPVLDESDDTQGAPEDAPDGKYTWPGLDALARESGFSVEERARALGMSSPTQRAIRS